MDAARPWGEPTGWHKFFGHSSAFIKAFSYLPAGKGVGRGRLLSLRPQQPFRNFFVILVVLRKHYRGLFTGMSQAFPGVGISAKVWGRRPPYKSAKNSRAKHLDRATRS